MMDDKVFYIVDGLPNLVVPINTALIDLQSKRQSSGKSLGYYAQHFYAYLVEKGVSDFCDVTAADIRFFAEKLVQEEKSSAVIQAYASLIGEVLDAFCELNGRPHITLLKGDAVYAAGGRGKKRRKHYTLASTIILRKANNKEQNATVPMLTYTKWYTPEDVNLVFHQLPLRDRCIFLCSIETGYRISSVLSIRANPEHIRNGFVEETFSKTGRLHRAQISPLLQRSIAEYMSNQRRCVTQKAARDDGYLFTTHKGERAGQVLSYNAFYLALKSAEKHIHETFPDKQGLILHTHAGRSTYFNTLMHQNLERKQAGEDYLSDKTVCHLMDWKTMDCLEAYYDFQERKILPSALYQDFILT